MAVSVKISPPLHNVSLPKILAPLPRTGLTFRHRPAKKNYRSRSPAEKWWSHVDGSYVVFLPATGLLKVLPHERIHKHKLYDRDVDEAILYYHVETRRKYKTSFEGVVLLLNSIGLPVNCYISKLILLNVRFSTGR